MAYEGSRVATAPAGTASPLRQLEAYGPDQELLLEAHGHRVDGKISLGETRGLDWHKIFQMKLLSL